MAFHTSPRFLNTHCVIRSSNARQFNAVTGDILYHLSPQHHVLSTTSTTPFPITFRPHHNLPSPSPSPSSHATSHIATSRHLSHLRLRQRHLKPQHPAHYRGRACLSKRIRNQEFAIGLDGTIHSLFLVLSYRSLISFFHVQVALPRLLFVPTYL